MAGAGIVHNIPILMEGASYAEALMITIIIGHTALFCPKWRHVEMFCTFFKDLKALLQISLTKHNYLSHLLPFWMQYIPKKSIFLDVRNWIFEVKLNI